jgi:hypothetical protein
LVCLVNHRKLANERGLAVPLPTAVTTADIKTIDGEVGGEVGGRVTTASLCSSADDGESSTKRRRIDPSAVAGVAGASAAISTPTPTPTPTQMATPGLLRATATATVSAVQAQPTAAAAVEDTSLLSKEPGMLRADPHGPNAAVGSGGPRGVLIALCCHQVCQLQHYCNPAFFREELGFDAAAFKQITQMSSWAVSGSRTTIADSDSESNDSDHIDDGEHVPQYLPPTVDTVDDTDTVGAATVQLHANIPAGANSVAARTGLSKQGQEEVGRLCKRLLDTGRIRFLEANGFSARLQVYIDRALSLENVVLVATPKPPL